jgi:hypothetical protein
MIMTMSSAFKALAAVALVGMLSACGATQARDDYYQSVAAAAQAQAAQSEARYRALATVANSGDPGAATAATMAIALTATPTITPQYIESEALSWGKALAMPVATLGGLFIQADVAKNASNNAKDVQLASYASNEAIQLGQQSMVTGLGAQWAEGAGASAAALSDLGVAGFNALNTAGDQTVALGTVGFETVDSVATTGFTTVDSVATTGFETVDSVATTGFGTASTLGVAGMVGIESVATAGMTDLVTMGVAGMDSTLTMGTIGVDGLGAMSVDYNTLLGDINTSNNALVGDISTDYQAVISELNAIIESLGTAGSGGS